ncbi:MAG TPA: hypothetical protein PK476_01815 [Candidatus Pacearchaeota archaeon]|nr:hypothetical protein [Candidatus Pacearchaeota archaeon]HQM24630.1 hypothetical protein [Candidatus Pacearchaeota archaeon]
MTKEKKDGIFIDTDEERKKEKIRNQIEASQLAFKWEKERKDIIECK